MVVPGRSKKPKQLYVGLYAEISVRAVTKYRRFEKEFKIAGTKTHRSV